MEAVGAIQRTGDRVFRWRVAYESDEGMGTETLHFTRLGALVSRWVWGRNG